MNILAVDTSYNKLVVAVFSEGNVASKIVSEGMKKNNSLVLPTIDEVLNKLNLNIADIDYYACVVGPGSFTGVRIGVSTLNAFEQVFNKKLVSITALEVLAYGIHADKFMTSIDARHENYYSAIFSGDFTNNIEYLCNTKADLDNFDGKVVIEDKDNYNIDALIEIAKHKINKGEFVDVLKPLYMKDSQAEREYKEKHKND